MITVTAEGKYALVAEGHAGQAQKGQDIVCSAMSMLMGSLAEFVLHNRERCIDAEVVLTSGYAKVRAYPQKEFEKECAGAFCMASLGIELLKSKHPEYVTEKTQPTGLPLNALIMIY